MKKITRAICGVTALFSVIGFAGCKSKKDDGAIKLTVWVSEADRKFATAVAEEFKAKNPDKKYQFVIDIQGENDVATRVLNDVENAADVYSCINDQLPKLINGDALAKIAGDRLERIKQANSEGAMESVTIKMKDTEGVYGMPYTDNSFFLYYDKSVLTETDVKSFDGILAKCTDKKQFAFPMADGWYTTSFFFGKDLGYKVEYDDNLAETSIECDFDNETGKTVAEAMWRYVKNKGFKADANDSKITAGFNDGSVIAAVSGIWNKTTIKEYLGENFAAAKLPTYTLNAGSANEEQVQLVSFAGYKLMGVNNYSKNKTDAMDFAEFYTNKTNQIKHFEERGYVPTDVEARADEKVQSDVCAKAITQQLQFSKTQKDVPSTLWVPMEGLGSAMITGAQSGSFDLAAQLKACVNAIEKKTV
ncbi:MAG: extracellular solute-binding protein [Clostridia bacterium]|nr:extracellular solute-binding protein [Clostridia bacterium]MBQ8447212.1 extracellular solute-binding protein [Clostridia bacterium]